MIFNYKKFLKENHHPEHLSNLEIYLKKMMRGVEDKIFFLSKIKTDCIVDFGCADGYILKQIYKFHPEIKLIGYDNDRIMLDAISEGEGITFTNDWNEVMKEVKKYKSATILLSSVIHEVYSYEDSPNKFWKNVFSNVFKYVAIRDMSYSDKFLPFSKDDIKTIKEHADEQQLNEFETRWGEIDNSYVNTLHWLLKYSYTDNWKRELNEDYLPLSIEELKAIIPGGWSIIFEDQHILGHVQRKIKNEIGINLTYPTHIKIIIKNNKK